MNNERSNMSREAVLRPLFIALPMPRGTDPESLLALYFIALEGLPLQAVQSVVTKIVKGLWPEPVTYCPRPPDLANMVRREYALMREHSKLTVSALPVPHRFRDLRVEHRERTCELATLGYVMIADGITRDTFHKNKAAWPSGALHKWAIDEVWAPAAAEFDATKIEVAPTEVADETHEPISSERAQDIARMLAIPNAKNVTAEQLAYRRRREAELADYNFGPEEGPNGEESDD